MQSTFSVRHSLQFFHGKLSTFKLLLYYFSHKVANAAAGEEPEIPVLNRVCETF